MKPGIVPSTAPFAVSDGEAHVVASPPAPSRVEAALRRFSAISLAEMKSVALMRRVDTKYAIHRAQLQAVLAAVEGRYAILDVDGRRAMHYASQYFDTPDCRFFNDHHNQRARRVKVRTRNYVDSELCFLEIKQKDAKGVTNKSRVPCDSQMSRGPVALTPDAQRFITGSIAERFPGLSVAVSELRPTVCNRFRRLTLVDLDRNERATIDWDLSSRLGPDELDHADLVIIEVKQDGYDRHAPIMTVLKEAGARPFRVSKYCLGMARLVPGLKANRFKQKLLRIDRITATTFN